METDSYDPTELDLIPMHEILWGMEGQYGVIRTLWSTQDAAILLSSTENTQSTEIFKRHQKNYLRNASVIAHRVHILCHINSC